MKKIFSILLVTTMLLYSVGYYIAYTYNKGVVKKEIRMAIFSGNYLHDQLVTIVVPTKNNKPITIDFEQVEENEIRYHGEMYDVVATRWDKDKVTFLCLSDKDETKLVSIFTKRLQKQHDDTQGNSSVLLIKFSISPFTVTGTVTVKRIMANTISQILIPLAPDKLSAGYRNIPSPPPWQA